MSRSHHLLAFATLALSIASAVQAQVPARRATPQSAPIVLVTAPAGNEARYRVREQLANRPLENDAVGKTDKVVGRIVVAPDGRILADSSRFTIDLGSLASDQPRRDNYVRRNTLQTAEFPVATFIPDSSSLRVPASARLAPGDYTFDLFGRLTLRGVTKPSVWKVRTTVTPEGEVRGTATTSFDFAEFDIVMPRIPFVLSIQDNITLEYDFVLVAQRP